MYQIIIIIIIIIILLSTYGSEGLVVKTALSQ